jgi:hypothetical protein
VHIVSCSTPHMSFGRVVCYWSRTTRPAYSNIFDPASF